MAWVVVRQKEESRGGPRRTRGPPNGGCDLGCEKPGNRCEVWLRVVHCCGWVPYLRFPNLTHHWSTGKTNLTR